MITPDNPYYRQVQLLVAVLPVVAEERCFALKGGIAINFFVRDMPRLSVDIDLAYLPGGDRASALREIDAALQRTRVGLQSDSPPFDVRITKRQDGYACAMSVREGAATVKIEVSPVLRGTVFPTVDRRILPRAEEAFGFAEVPVLSFEDLFAGKLVAALDRQHPRDLFDPPATAWRGHLAESVPRFSRLPYQSRRIARSPRSSKTQADRRAFRASVCKHDRGAGHGRAVGTNA
jgi:predicted nucleotidyltransferase component of viral defense system